MSQQQIPSISSFRSRIPRPAPSLEASALSGCPALIDPRQNSVVKGKGIEIASQTPAGSSKQQPGKREGVERGISELEAAAPRLKPHFTVTDVTVGGRLDTEKQAQLEGFIREVYGRADENGEVPLHGVFTWHDNGRVEVTLQLNRRFRDDSDRVVTAVDSIGKQWQQHQSSPSNMRVGPSLSTVVYKFFVLLLSPQGATALSRISSTGARGVQITSADKRHRQLYESYLRYSTDGEWFIEDRNVNSILHEMELFKMNKEAVVTGEDYPRFSEMIERAESELEAWARKLEAARCRLHPKTINPSLESMTVQSSSVSGGTDARNQDIRKIIELAIFLLASCKRLEAIAIGYLGKRGKNLAKSLKKMNPSEMIDNCLETIFEGFCVLGKLNGTDNTVLKLRIDKAVIQTQEVLMAFRERATKGRGRSFAVNARALEMIETATDQIVSAISHSTAIMKTDQGTLESANKILPGKKGVIGSTVSIFGGATALGAACYLAEGVAAISTGGIAVPAILAASGVGGLVASSICRGKRSHLKDLLEEEKKVYDLLLDAFMSLVQHARLYEHIYLDPDWGYRYKTWVQVEPGEISSADERELENELSEKEQDLARSLEALRQVSAMEEARMRKQGKRV